MSNFEIGIRAQRAEFRSTDLAGRPVDPAAETPTARDERVRALQDQRLAQGERGVPSAEPAAVLTEWMASHPEHRMSAFAMAIAEDPGKMPACEVEPRPGEPVRRGGLLERMAAMRRARGSAG